MKSPTFPNPAAPTPFASVRGSRDLSLAAFGVALLTAFALHAAAFLPRLPSPEASEVAMAARPAPASMTASQAVRSSAPRG
jgi:hypothetical protein